MICSKRKPTEYALYKGELLLSVGTLDEIAQEMNVTKQALRHYGTPRYARGSRPIGSKPPKHYARRVLVRLEDDED